MKDLLENKCGVIADKEELKLICDKYRIPFTIENANCCRLWVISRKGVCFGNVGWFLRANSGYAPIFKSAHALDMYLFNYLLIAGSACRDTQFNEDELLKKLREFVGDKFDYVNHITNYPLEDSDDEKTR